MIVVASKPGYLGNMIIMHASFLSFAWKNKIKLHNPAFHDYNRYFEGSEKMLTSVIPYNVAFFTARVLDRLRLHNNPIVNARCIDWEEQVDLDNPREAEKFSAGFHFVQGWKFRANAALGEYRNQILAYFTPVAKYRQEIGVFVKEHFSADTVNIGIHIRRGDYKHFEDGQFYFELEEYVKLMHKLIVLFSGRKIRFLLTSNEVLNQTFFNDNHLPVIFAPQHELLDMYILSHCDFIAGPPSTYTMWASFYGSVPLYMMRKKDADPLLGDFKVQTYF